jgi:hypothetical protein
MASIGELNVIIRADDQFSVPLKRVHTSLSTNLTATRQLAMGVTHLGMTFMSMGFMLKNTKTALGETIGGTLMFVGSIATAIGASLQFILAIGKMVKALRALQIQQILTQAFSGPAGWAMLAGGVAVAGLTIAATNAKVAKQTSPRTGNTVNVTVMGSVATEQKISDSVRKGILASQDRNSTSGIK